MFDLLFDNTTMPVLQQVMVFSENRQQVLADNIANLDTPGYRQTDLAVDEFTGVLQKAIHRQDDNTPHRFEMGSTRNIQFGATMQAKPVPVRGLMNYYDGANRSVERVMSEVGKNAIWHNMAVELFRQQSALLETAIRERL